MEVQTAIELTGALIYKPNWTITAEDHTRRFEGAICVHFEYPAIETNRAEARLGYPIVNRPRAHFPVTVAHFVDDCDLYRAIMGCILMIEEHEAREALRIAPTFWAPFHPHRADGMVRWGTPERDMRFGVA